MFKLIKKLLIFCGLLLLPMVIGFLLPAPNYTPRHFLYGKQRKDSMLAHNPSPRMILVGGSNVSLGLDSKKIQDSLGLRPINTATHAALGLIYMMDNTLRFVKEGDIVLVAPEYDQFFGDFGYGGYELLVTTVDVDRSTINLLSAKHWMNLYQFIPKFTFTRLNPMTYKNPQLSVMYSETSFNEYGDVTRHWDMPTKFYVPSTLKGDVNENIFKALKTFETAVASKKAKMYLTFPGFQESSYNGNKEKVELVEATFRKMNFDILGNAVEYKLSDSLTYDTPYHLSGEGVKIRTERLIGELKAKLAKR